jgi:hypothetical protein
MQLSLSINKQQNGTNETAVMMSARIAPNPGGRAMPSPSSSGPPAGEEEATGKPKAGGAGGRPQTARPRANAFKDAAKPAMMAMLAKKPGTRGKQAKRPGSAALLSFAKEASSSSASASGGGDGTSSSSAAPSASIAWPWRSVLDSSSAELESLSGCLRLCAASREEMAWALGETEKKVPYTFKEDHDRIMQCKTAITPLIRAIPKLTEACEALEADAASALKRLRSEDALMLLGQVGTVRQLHYEREAAYACLSQELFEVDEGHSLSMRMLLSRLANEEAAHRETEERRAEMSEEVEALSAQLEGLQKDMALLRADHQKALAEERKRHERTRTELTAEIRVLHGALAELEHSSEHTAETLTGRLTALAAAKEASEASLRDAAHATEEAGKRLASRLTGALETLQQAKEESERELGGQLTRKAGEQAELHRKLGLMEKLQEKALGVGQAASGRPPTAGAKAAGAVPPPPPGPDTRNPMAGDPHRSRNRAALYALAVERGIAAGKVQAPKP